MKTICLKDIPYAEFCEKFGLKDAPPGLREKALNIVWGFSLPMTPEELWPSIADTSSFNRFLGLSPRQEKEVDGKKVVKTTMVGFAQEWIEQPWTWVRGSWIRSERQYITGVAKSVTSNFLFEKSAEGVHFYVHFSWITKNALCYYFLKATESVLKNKFLSAFEKIIQFNEGRKVVLGRALSIANDPEKNVNLPALEKAIQTLKKTSLSQPAIDGLCEFLKTGDDIDLTRIQVPLVARHLNVPQKDLLKVCLESVRVGLLSITWDVVCPHCRGVRLAAQSIGQIPAEADCLVCEVDFQTDTLESIEVVFHIHPSYRKVTEVLFCAAEPAKKDHILVQQKLSPGQVFQFHQKLKSGRHRLRVTNPTENFYLDVHADSPETHVNWNFESGREKVQTKNEVNFALKNESTETRSVVLEQLWWKDNTLHPASIFAMPEYQDIFSRDTLGAQIKISMGVHSVMFTDIINSTGFYNEKGDSAAFAEVKRHFAETFAVVEKHDGAVIKTIGDSTMAFFSHPESAFLAAMEIQKKFSRSRTDTSIRLRISLNSGPVIAVHLLQGMDLFGATVNKAAKLQACAHAHEIACSQEFIQALEPRWFEEYVSHFVLKKSSLIFKEMPLEAFVLNCEDLEKTLQQSA